MHSEKNVIYCFLWVLQALEKLHFYIVYFYIKIYEKLALKRNQATVTSYQQNEVILGLEFFDRNRKKTVTFNTIDVPGQGHFRTQIQTRFPQVLGVVVVIDSSSRQGNSQAGEILYDLLNSTNLRKNNIPILIVCNKQDLSEARKPQQIEKELETEM